MLRQRAAKLNSPARATSVNDLTAETVFTEDFSLMTGGTEDAPDMTEISDLAGTVVNNGYPIPTTYVHTEGCTGYGLHQAGGAMHVGVSQFGGFFNTPAMNMQGLVRISFRAKALKSIQAISISLGVSTEKGLQLAGTWSERTFENEGWTEINLETYNKYAEDAFLQIGFRTYNQNEPGFLIDDLKVEVVRNYVAGPTDIQYRSFTPEGFEAAWSPIEGAEKYLVNVYEEQTTGNAPETKTLDFNGEFDREGGLYTNAEGWKIQTLNGKGYVGEFGPEGEKEMVFAMGREDEYFETPANGGRITDMTFDIVSDLGENPEAQGAQARLYGWNGQSWEYITNFGTFFEEDGYSAHIDVTKMLETLNEGPDAMFPVYFQGLYSKVKVVGESLNYGVHLIFKNISVTYEPAAKETLVKTLEAEGNTIVVDGLDIEMNRYYIGVKGVKNDIETAEYRNEAFGIWTPTPAEPEVISGNSYAANWEPVSIADAYLVSNFECFIPELDTEAFLVIGDNFDKVTSSKDTPSSPQRLGNTENILSLDKYTHTPGWLGAGNTIINGAIGCQKGFIPGQYAIITPSMLTLNNGGGNFIVSGRVHLEAGSQLVCSSTYFDGVTPAAEETGWMEFEFPMQGGQKHDQLAFFTLDAQPFMLDQIEVRQDLLAGDQVLTLVESKEVASGTTATFHLSDPAKTYAYDVMAGRVHYSQNAVSDYSPTVLVKMSELGVEDITAAAANSVIAGKGFLKVTEDAAVYTLDGRLIAKPAAGETVVLPAGIYLVRTATAAVKALVK